MSKNKIMTVFLSIILLVSMSNTLFANLVLEQTDQTQTDLPRVNGLLLPRIDGLVDTSAPSGYISEWADAYLQTISIVGPSKQELPAVQLSTKVVLDRILIGLIIPVDTLSLNFVKMEVTYDIDSSGTLNDGDVRLSFSNSGMQTVEVYSKSGFVDISQSGLGLDQASKPQEVLSFSNSNVHIFDKSIQAEFDFNLAAYTKLIGSRITIVGQNFGKGGYSVGLVLDDANGSPHGYGYPSIPTIIQTNDGIDLTIDTYNEVYFVPGTYIPTICKFCNSPLCR